MEKESGRVRERERERKREQEQREREREYNTSPLKSLVYLGTLSTVCLLHSSAPSKNIVACEKDGHPKNGTKRK